MIYLWVGGLNMTLINTTTYWQNMAGLNHSIYSTIYKHNYVLCLGKCTDM